MSHSAPLPERRWPCETDSGEKMDSIAEMFGYENGNSFWIAFKRATGISPKQYQKQLGKK
jgi:AraC-like DNA-binding protein